MIASKAGYGRRELEVHMKKDAKGDVSGAKKSKTDKDGVHRRKESRMHPRTASLTVHDTPTVVHRISP